MELRWETESEDDSVLSDSIYHKIKSKLTPALEIISPQKKPDEELPKLKLLYPYRYPESLSIPLTYKNQCSRKPRRPRK